MSNRNSNRSLKVERLQDRCMMAADIALGADGVLRITGSVGDDQISVRQVAWGDVKVTITSGGATIREQLFEDVPVNSLLINGDSGNDTIKNLTSIPSVIFGGDGQDTVFGGASQDQIYGGLGDDILNGGDGDDYLNGNGGTDWLYGQAGNDSVFGGDDTVVDYIFGGTGSDQFNTRIHDRLMDFSEAEKDFDKAAK